MSAAGPREQDQRMGRNPDAAIGGRTRRGVGTWVLLALGAEKVVQHTFVTAVLFADAFDLREQLSLDYRWFAVSGGLAGVGYLVATAGLARGSARWALPLLGALALFDVVGEFVAQATVSITVTVSFLVALAIVALVVGAVRQPSGSAGA